MTSTEIAAERAVVQAELVKVTEEIETAERQLGAHVGTAKEYAGVRDSIAEISKRHFELQQRDSALRVAHERAIEDEKIEERSRLEALIPQLLNRLKEVSESGQRRVDQMQTAFLEMKDQVATERLNINKQIDEARQRVAELGGNTSL